MYAKKNTPLLDGANFRLYNLNRVNKWLYLVTKRPWPYNKL